MRSTIFNRLAQGNKAAIPARLRRPPTRRKGASLLEILAAVLVASGLSWLTVLGVQNIRSNSKGTTCLSNLRQIHQAALLYRAEYQAYPAPEEDQTLQTLLAPWLGSNSRVFHCPEDSSGNSDSYSYYYAPRSVATESDNYMLGCPRHEKYARGIAVYAGSHTEMPSLEPVLHGDAIATPGSSYDHGMFTFSDGSTATIGAGRGGRAMTVSHRSEHAPDLPSLSALFSIHQGNGKYYTVVKMKDGDMGTVTFDIVPGNRFEVVTPAAVIAVRGTRFSVTTLRQGGKAATRVYVENGSVDMESAAKGRPLKLNAGEQGLCVKGEAPQLE